MVKNLLIALIAVLFFQNVSAQQSEKDTLLFYVKESYPALTLVRTKDSADYIMYNLPADPKTGLYKVVQVFPNGKPKLIAGAVSRNVNFNMEGVCTEFFANGKRKSIGIYRNNNIAGDIINYYPNGQQYTFRTFGGDGKQHLEECRDSTGQILAKKGNGKWLKFDADLKNVIEEGPIENGVENGDWLIVRNGKKYPAHYTNGELTTELPPDTVNKVYVGVQIEPVPVGGFEAFYDFLGRTVRYPAIDQEYHVMGKAFITFVVERNGSLTNVHVKTAPSQTMGEEAVRAIRLSPRWKPGTIGGQPVRVQYTVPVSFTLGND